MYSGRASLGMVMPCATSSCLLGYDRSTPHICTRHERGSGITSCYTSYNILCRKPRQVFLNCDRLNHNTTYSPSNQLDSGEIIPCKTAKLSFSLFYAPGTSSQVVVDFMATLVYSKDPQGRCSEGNF